MDVSGLNVTPQGGFAFWAYGPTHLHGLAGAVFKWLLAVTEIHFLPAFVHDWLDSSEQR